MTEFERWVLEELRGIRAEQRSELLALRTELRADLQALRSDLQGRAPARTVEPDPAPDFRPGSRIALKIGGAMIPISAVLWLVAEALKLWPN